MIQIKKNKKGLFHVTYVAENGEILAHSETFTAKQSAWKNISAMYKLFPPAEEPNYTYVQDLTIKTKQVYLYNLISKSKLKR